MIQSFDLDGGCKLLVDTTAAADVAAVGVWYGIGSRDESTELRGATHVVEHMLFKGTGKHSASRIAGIIDKTGGTINAFTERECMALYSVVPSDAFEDAASILLEMIHDSVFDKDDYNLEKQIIFNELEASNDDPEEQASDAFLRAVWGDHPAALKIGAELDELKSLAHDKVLSYYKECFQSRPHIISVAGGIDPERAYQVFSSKMNLFKSIKKTKRTKPPVRYCPSAWYQKQSVQYSQVFYALEGSSCLSGDEYYSIGLANAALGGTLGSRLFQNLREQRGLCYTISSSPSHFTDTSLWSVYGTCSSENTIECIQRIQEEVYTVSQNGFTEQEIETAKAHLAGMITIASQDSEYRMRRLVRQYLQGTHLMSCSESIACLQDISLDAVNSAFRDFAKSKPYIFASGPRRFSSLYRKNIWENQNQ